MSLLLVRFPTLAAWLSACARTVTVANGDGYFLASLAGPFAAIALAAVAGLLVGIGTAVF